MFWRALSPVEIVAFAAATVFLIGIILALLTPRGREAFALLGLRIADALTAWLERRLSARARVVRAAARALSRRHA